MGKTLRLGAAPRPVREPAVAIAFGGAYLLAAELTRALETTDPALIWVPSGLYVGVLIVCGRSLWPLLVCAALAASFGSNLLSGHSPTESLAFAVPSAAEGLLGALVVLRVAKGRFSLKRLPDVAALVVGAAIVANGLTALSAAAADSQAFDVSFTESWLRWWSAHGLGIVLVCPLVASLFASPRLPSRSQLPQMGVVAAGLAIPVLLLYTAEPLGAAAVVACAAALPLLLWASWRWSPTAAALGVLPVALAATFLAPHTADPLGLGGIPSAEILVVQLSVAILAIASLAFAAAVAESREAGARAERRERRLRTLVDTAPEAYVAIDDEGRITEWSPRAQAVLGWTRDEALGRRLHETFVPASGRAAWMAEVERRATARDAGAEPCRLTAVDKEGCELAAEVTISASAPADETATHIFIEDVRERERVRDELKAAEKDLAAKAAEVARADEDARHLQDGLARTSEELERIRAAARRDRDDAATERERLCAELTRIEEESAAAGMAAAQDRQRLEETAAQDRQRLAEVAAQDRQRLEEVAERLGGERERLERALDAMVMSFAEADRERTLLARRATELIVRYDRLGICRYASPACSRLLGYEPHELVGKQGADLMHREDRGHLGVARASDDDTTFDARLIRKDGTLVRAQATISPVRDPENGKLVALEASLRRLPEEGDASRDASPRRRISRARFDAAFGQAPMGMALLRRGGGIRRANAALCRLSGYSREQLEATTLRRLVSPDERAGLDAAMGHVSAGERPTLQSEHGLVRADGRVIPVQLSVSAVQDREEQPVELVVHLHDLSHRADAPEEPARLTDHDPLTGLYSPERFEQELRSELDASGRYGTRGAILVADLDGFAALNDLLGLTRCDELTRDVAHAIRGRLRSTDVAGRTDRGQFAVLLRRAGPSQAGEVASALLEAARRAGREGEGERVELAASIGIAVFGDGREVRAEELLVEAEIAVQDAKEAGGDRTVVFDPAEERPVSLSEGLGWADQIRSAIEDDRFRVYAEPVLSLAEDRTPRHELLPRMVSPSGDFIPPAAFLPAAERFGVAGELDRWLLRAAIAVLARDSRAGSGARVEVSLSTKAPADPELHSFVATELHAAGVDPAGLCIAIAETAAVQGTDRTAVFLRRLAELGCELGLDRFGAGVASFLHVERLPITYVKLDGALIERLESDESARLVVKAITDVAHGLGMRTVAPRVSDHGTVHLLRGLRVGYAQGPALALARASTDSQVTRPPAAPRS